MMKKICFTIIALILIFNTGFALATTRYVRVGGINSGDCTSALAPCGSIQYALNMAGSVGSETIKIATGTYKEILNIPIPANQDELLLSLSGGWDNDFNESCEAGNTILTGPDGSTQPELIRMFNQTMWNTSELNLSCLSLQGNSISHPYSAILLLSDKMNTIKLSLNRCQISSFPGRALILNAKAGSQMTAELSHSTIRNNSALMNGNWSAIGLNAEAEGSGTALNLTLDSCQVLENIGDNEGNGGGGVSLGARDGAKLKAHMVNTVVAANQDKYSGAGVAVASIDASEIELGLLNCTITGNKVVSSGAGGGLEVYASDTAKTSVSMINTIIWGNKNKDGIPDDVYLYENALNNSASVSVIASYSILGTMQNEQDRGIFTDNGHNLNIDPMLNATYHLREGAPAIDKGVCGYYAFYNYYRVAPEKDMDDQARPGVGMLTGCDIGADEYYPSMLCFPVRSKMGTTSMICL
ncbi:MAG: hypothetical protein K9K37_04790 [Desulfocapsa sp.]|nr:hypothetical protein [Desulfocapsa sp.]